MSEKMRRSNPALMHRALSSIRVWDFSFLPMRDIHSKFWRTWSVLQSSIVRSLSAHRENHSSQVRKIFRRVTDCLPRSPHPRLLLSMVQPISVPMMYKPCDKDDFRDG